MLERLEKSLGEISFFVWRSSTSFKVLGFILILSVFWNLRTFQNPDDYDYSVHGLATYRVRWTF